jgi:hypothetical protein
VTFDDAYPLVAGVPLVVIIPACVELAKRSGLPVRYAGLMAVLSGVVLLALRDLALGSDPHWAAWLIGGVVYGLAAAGLYSQTAMLAGKSSGEAVGTGSGG